MKCRQLRVERLGARWKIKMGDIQRSPYASKLLAIEAAIDAARRLDSDGGSTQVLVQQDDCSYRVLWTGSPYPAAGFSTTPI